MHIIANPKHRNWFGHSFDGDCRVLLDGSELREVVEADDRVGFAVVAILGADGMFVHDGVNIITKRVQGNIEFVGNRIS